MTDLLRGEQERPSAQLADLPCSATKLRPGFTTQLACSLPWGAWLRPLLLLLALGVGPVSRAFCSICLSAMFSDCSLWHSSMAWWYRRAVHCKSVASV